MFVGGQKVRFADDLELGKKTLGNRRGARGGGRGRLVVVDDGVVEVDADVTDSLAMLTATGIGDSSTLVPSSPSQPTSTQASAIRTTQPATALRNMTPSDPARSRLRPAPDDAHTTIVPTVRDTTAETQGCDHRADPDTRNRPVANGG